jgi:hypothetical protein
VALWADNPENIRADLAGLDLENDKAAQAAITKLNTAHHAVVHAQVVDVPLLDGRRPQSHGTSKASGALVLGDTECAPHIRELIDPAGWVGAGGAVRPDEGG